MPDDYNLPRHADESSRLELQHDAYVKIVGFVLHPRIAAALPENARIADVGTGTGIWLHDVSKSGPSTWAFQGFDISDAQFPKDGKRERTTFELLDITGDVPERLQGQFDVVHLRLLVCGLQDPQWAQAARNVMKLLKPGGWIQWHESQFSDLTIVQGVPGAETKANEKVYDAAIATLQEQHKIDHNVQYLQKTVQAAGFEDCEQDVFASGRLPEIRKQLMGVQFGAVQSLSRALQDAPGHTLKGQELEDALEAAREELEDGKAYHEYVMRIVTGRKPA